MIKMPKLIVSLALTLFVSAASAQDYAFKVLVNKGNNQIRKGQSWEAVKVGTSLASVDELKVSENSYVGLVHSSGKPYEVKKAGNYKVAEMAKKVGTTQSVLNKYTEFILSSNDPAKNRLSATGAVHRGDNGIQVFLPVADKAYIFNDSVTFNWSELKVKGPYTIVISNLWEDVLLKGESKTNSFAVNFADKRFSKETEFRVEILSADKKKSDAYTVRKMSPAERNKLKSIVSELQSVENDGSALYKMMQAGVYEQNGLLIDGATIFQKAVKQEPSLTEAYENFLLRNKMKLPEETQK